MKDHRSNYATDTTLESDVGYEAKVGDPVVEAEMTVDGDGIIFPCKEIHEGNYLVTLEVNGVPILYRESVMFLGSVQGGDPVVV